jgi:hypothetical protein
VNTTQYNPAKQEGGLFSEYINTFLKIKQEASGWPDWCQTEQQRQEYIDQYAAHEGIALDPTKIVKNPGLRSLSKLLLNSMWGKWAQRSNMRQTRLFKSTEMDEFFKLILSSTVEILDYHIISDDIIQVNWQHKEDFVPPSNKTNIFIATFTTCWARLKLYKILAELDDRVIYFDTDSVVYISRPGEYEPPLGDFLGDLSDEIGNGHFIEEFVSGGPKNYAYRLDNGKETCKVRGFTLNFTNSKLVNFGAVKEMLEHSGHTIPVVNPREICRDAKKWKLYNKRRAKKYGLVYTKRVHILVRTLYLMGIDFLLS